MLVIDVELNGFTRRSRSVVVSHRDLAEAIGLARGLEPGERVRVRAQDGELHTAVVDDIEFELEDTRYRLTVGGRVPGDLAADPDRDRQPGSVGLDEVVELLGRASTAHLREPLRVARERRRGRTARG